MPTARPIIIEKFIDHTDIGMNQPSTCRSAKPDRDAGEREHERDAGRDQHAERDEQQDQRRQAADELGLVQRFGVDLVEVAPHRPFTGDLGARAGRELQLARRSCRARRPRPDGRRPCSRSGRRERARCGRRAR